MLFEHQQLENEELVVISQPNLNLILQTRESLNLLHITRLETRRLLEESKALIEQSRLLSRRLKELAMPHLQGFPLFQGKPLAS